MFGQEGLRERTRKDIEDLHLAKCSTLYSAVLTMYTVTFRGV